VTFEELAGCLFLSPSFSVRNDLLGWLSPPPHISLLNQLEHLYCYRLDDVPDVDQRWSSLPADGANYCVPAASMNWLYYLGAPPDPDVDGLTILNLIQLGDQMGTDGADGTSFEGGIDGLVGWLDDRNVLAVVMGATVTDGASVRIEHLRAWATLGGLVDVNMGRYRKNGDKLKRKSGHRMTMVGLHQKDSHCKIVVHNPDNDRSHLTTQSPTKFQKASLTHEHWNIEGDWMTLPRWVDSSKPGYKFIEGYVVIAPPFTVTNSSANALTYHQTSLTTHQIATRSFRLPFPGGWPTLPFIRGCLGRRSSEKRARGSGCSIWRAGPGADSPTCRCLPCSASGAAAIDCSSRRRGNWWRSMSTQAPGRAPRCPTRSTQ